MMRIAIIGAAQGGYEAVASTHTLHPDAEIMWFDQGDFADIVTWGPARGRPETAEIREMDAAQLAANHIMLLGQHQVTALEPELHQLTSLNLATGQHRTHHYDKLILAVGAHPFRLPVPGADLTGVQTVRHDHMTNLAAGLAAGHIRRAVVVGSGYIGLMAADALNHRGVDVTVIDVVPRILGTYLDAELTDVLTARMYTRGVHLALDQQVQRFEGDHRGNVTQVVTATDTIPADLVIMAAGTRPNTNWLRGSLMLTKRGYIATDDCGRTSAADVFAVGDCTEILYTPSGTRFNIALASNAQLQARTAAANLVHPVNELRGVQGSSALKLFGEYFASTGLNTTTARKMQIACETVYVEQDHISGLYAWSTIKPERVQFKLFYEPTNHQILGAQIMARVDQTQQINAISIAIQLGMTIDQLAGADFFFQPELTNRWNIMSVAAQKAVSQARTAEQVGVRE